MRRGFPRQPGMNNASLLKLAPSTVEEVVMARFRSCRIACTIACAIVALSSRTITAWAQVPSEALVQSAAAKASPELVNGLAKELGSTPEQAAAAAGVLFSLAKSFLKPEDFAAVSKTVPGMDALLAATPAGVVPGSGSAARGPSMLTPGFASSSSSSTTGAMSAASDPLSSAAAGFSKLGIKPEMIAKALPFLAGYLKKYGGAALASILGGLFKGAGAPGK